jgi:hypothetical protein
MRFFASLISMKMLFKQSYHLKKEHGFQYLNHVTESGEEAAILHPVRLSPATMKGRSVWLLKASLFIAESSGSPPGRRVDEEAMDSWKNGGTVIKLHDHRLPTIRRDIMERRRVVKIVVALAFLLGCLAWPFCLPAEEPPAEKKAARQDIEKKLESTLDMPILKGDLWQKMTPDSKVSFIWGIGHVVAIEQHLMEKYPQLKTGNFASKAFEGMSGVSMDEIIARIDKYYSANPDKIDKPVISVLWDTSIKPYIKAGIAGQNLK